MIGQFKKRPRAIGLPALAVASSVFIVVSSAAIAAEHVVEIRSFKFVPEHLTVEIGDKVTWINRDIAPHTATAKDRTWDTKRLKKNESNSIIVSQAMTLRYFCRFHPHMKAVLVMKSD